MSADGWFCGCGHRLAIPDVCPLCGWACDSAGRVTPANTPPPPAPEPVAAPIEGFRVWRVQRDDHVTLTRALVQRLYDDHEAGRNPFRALIPGARLYPVASATGAWERVQHAVCTQAVRGGLAVTAAWSGPVAPHEAPQRGCGCGLWALKDEAEAHAVAAEYQLGSGYAVGKLRLWGRVVEHTRGYRGQHAQPLELTYVGDGPDAEETAAELAAFYGCPCTLQAPAVPNPYPLGLDPTMLRGGGSVRVRGGVTAASAYAAQLASLNVLNSGVALARAQSSAAQTFISTNVAAPYDQGSRRAWLVRFARWTVSNHSAGLSAYMLLSLAPLCGGIIGAFGLGVLWALPVALLSPAWFIFWLRANK